MNDINLNLFNFEIENKPKYDFILDKPKSETMKFYDLLNKEDYHYQSKDDTCTPMSCVEHMINLVPGEFWKRKKKKILDPCCGNGNFPAYLSYKTSIDEIWMNDLSEIRYKNAIELLNPKNIFNGDFFSLFNEENSFDLIIGNPPYSGGGNKNRSLSNAFIERSVKLLRTKGYLCFITPNNWMTYNNNNRTLKALLSKGSFLVIDHDVKRYFPRIGSSFTVFLWQKEVYDNTTKVFNNYLIKDVQDNVSIPNNLNFIPLYLSQTTIQLAQKLITNEEKKQFKYRCDLHNFTQKSKLNDEPTEVYKYKTIHTVNKTRYASIKQDIYDKTIIVIPLSTYFKPFITTNTNLTQSVGYIEFESYSKAEKALKKLTLPWFKLLIHVTRYGNFNNIKILKNIDFERKYIFEDEELLEIKGLAKKIKY